MFVFWDVATAPCFTGGWWERQTTEDLVDYAKECCVFCQLTDTERQQFGLLEH